MPRVAALGTELRTYSATNSDPAPYLTSDVATTWPLPAMLMARLDELADDPQVSRWALTVSDLCEDLARTSLTDRRASSALLGRIEASMGDGRKLAARLTDRKTQASVRRAIYAIARRHAAWRLALAAVPAETILELRTADARNTDARNTEASESLPAFLQFRASDRPTQRAAVAKRRRPQPSSSRYAARPQRTSPGVLGGPSGEEDRTRRVVALLASLEAFEASPTPAAATKVARQMGELSGSDARPLVALAATTDDHWRNANVRMNFTQELIDQMLPRMPSQEGQVDDVINGVPVWGWQETSTELSTEFLEDTARLRLRLVASGAVYSDTQASKGPATVFNCGYTDFQVSKVVILTPKGIALARTQAYANSYSNLSDVETSVDGVPLFGSLARNMARNKFEKQKSASLAVVERRVASEARARFDKELTPRIVDAAHDFHRRVWSPLTALELEPTPIEMKTEADRVITRFRVAAADQLAAHTARPRAPGDSLASLQIHESFFNNALDQFDLDGKTLMLPELFTHIAKSMGRPDAELPEDLDKRVKFVFAKENAVRVRCHEGHVEITLALDELSRGKKNRWTNLLVRARYEPKGEGLEAQLARQEGIELIGEDLRTRDQIALRGIFSKVFSRSRAASLIPKEMVEHQALQHLEVTQFSIADGWIALAIGPKLVKQTEEGLQSRAAPRWKFDLTGSSRRQSQGARAEAE